MISVTMVGKYCLRGGGHEKTALSLEIMWTCSYMPWPSFPFVLGYPCSFSYKEFPCFFLSVFRFCPESLGGSAERKNRFLVGFSSFLPPKQWKEERKRSGEGVVRRSGCPKGCFWRVRFFSAPLRFSLAFQVFKEKTLRGQRRNGLSKSTLLDNRPFLRTTPSPLFSSFLPPKQWKEDQGVLGRGKRKEIYVIPHVTRPFFLFAPCACHPSFSSFSRHLFARFSPRKMLCSVEEGAQQRAWRGAVSRWTSPQSSGRKFLPEICVKTGKRFMWFLMPHPRVTSEWLRTCRPFSRDSINSVHTMQTVKTSGFTRGVRKNRGFYIKFKGFLVEFLESRRSSENQKPPENRQKSGLFWASPFTVCTYRLHSFLEIQENLEIQQFPKDQGHKGRVTTPGV